ncbi:MAG: metal ABC transporter permease [Halanaerobiales bacterium]
MWNNINFLSNLYQMGESIVIRLINIIIFFINLLPEKIAEPFQFQFMQRALLTSILVGLICGVLSCYIVLKRWSLLGDAISHAVLPGVALAYLLGLPFFLGAFVTGSLTSIGIGFIERNSRIKEDAAMGIMFTGSFALGIVIISRIATSTHLMHILFGNVLGVRMPVLLITLLVTIISLIILFLFHRHFFLYTFDPIQANISGMNTSLIHYGLMLLLTLCIVASLETVGIILVVAMLITPGSTAYLIANDLRTMMIISAIVGIVSSIIGLYLSFVFNIASGGAIVLVATIFFLITFIFAPEHGLINKILA